MKSGSTKIAMSKIQLTIARVVNIVHVSIHTPVLPDISAMLLQIAEKFCLHTKRLLKKAAILQRTTKTIRVRFA